MTENPRATRRIELGMSINRLEKPEQVNGERKKAPPLPKKDNKKQQFTTDEVLTFDLDPSKKFHHRIEYYSGKSEQIMIDEEFLLEDGADPEKVLEEMKK
uniref:Uncharacterized protein n=1 Tax=Euplotes crassus TaxID=5936 RepID=A0A7S3P2H4_EUPCR|mmetsp:Transcript_8275/g.7859  ORF Transcript_8275/g.7859 Transcript_8275/m.7859 type:complete len:100 (+) Transcript_8275:112-411(+)